MIGRSTVLLLVLALLSSAPLLQAQQANNPDLNSAGTDLNRTLRDLQKTRIEKDLRREMQDADKEKKSEAPVDEKKPAAPEVTVKISEIEFTTSSVIASDTLRALAAGYENRDVGVAELYELVVKVNQIYRDGGYVTAMAMLPAQKIEDGRLKIMLIEGKVGRVLVEGNATTDFDYIADRVNVPVGKVVSIKSLDKNLQWFNGTNDAKLRIKLQAGVEPGTTDYLFSALEPAESQGSIFSDTAGSTNTGRTRLGVSYTSNSLSGIRDMLNLTALYSSTSKAGILNYSRPINARGTKLSFYHSFNELAVYQEDVNGFNIKGKSSSFGLNLTQPLEVRTRYKEELIFDVQKQISLNKVFGMNFVDDTEERYSVGKSYLWLAPGEALYCKPVFSYCEYDGLAERKHVKKMVLDGLWQKRRLHGQMLNFRLNWQQTPDKYLPSADQYYLGGLYSVRGYNESVVGGDYGVNLKFDYFFPAAFDKKTQLFFFYDWGRIYGKSLLSTRMIHSYGLGLSHSFVNDSYVSLTVGYPLVDLIGDEKIAPQKVDLAVNLSF